MLKQWIGLSLLSLVLNIATADTPELLELKLTGSGADASIEPSSLQLMQGQTYLLVLENPFSMPYHFDAPTLNGAISTQYIQGSSSVSQRSILISPESKVQWLLSADKPGLYPIKAILGQGETGYSRKAGAIEILAKEGVKEDQDKETLAFNLPDGGYKSVLKSNEVDYEPKEKSRRIMPKKERHVRGRPN